MNEAGWEIATHGYKWIDYRDMPAEVEAPTHRRGDRHSHRGRRRAAARLLPGPHRRSTRSLSAWRRAASSIAPTPTPTICPIGSRDRRGPQLIVPYTLDSNDMRFATPQGFNSGDQFFAYLKDSFDTLYAEGATAPKMLSIGLHCRLVGRPGRAASLARFLDYVRTPRQGLGRDPPRHRAPLDRTSIRPRAAGSLRRMTRTLFVERFGGVYEHSPWVAEAAYRCGAQIGGATAPPGSLRRWRARWLAGERGRQTRADQRPSGSRRQTRSRRKRSPRNRPANRRAPGSTG